MVKTERCKNLVTCKSKPLDPEKPKRAESQDADHRPSILLNVALGLQHVLVFFSLCALVVFTLIQEVNRERIVAHVLFYSGAATLLQSWFGSRLPLIQAPSLDFLVPAVALLTSQSGSHGSCKRGCIYPEEPLVITNTFRELSGMTVAAGLVQLAVGSTGLGGFVLRRCAPLALAPLLCMLGFSIYREAALLCSDHWGIALLAVILLVVLSQHLRSYQHLSVILICRRLSVLLSVIGTWTVCAALMRWGNIHLNSVTQIMLNKANSTSQHSPDFIFPNHSLPWLDFPLPAWGLPLLSGRSIAAGVAAGLSASISSPAVYVLAARLLRAPVPPAHACNRGLTVDGLVSVFSGLMGAPVGQCSSVSNACVISLSKAGSRSTVQIAGVLLSILGLSPRLAQILCSIPLAIHGAVLSVTYALAVATGITYFQHTDVDSGRNIFNIGFTTFMSLALARCVDVLLQSLLTLPVFLVGVLAFLLEHTVSGSLLERGLVRDEGSQKIQSLADQQQGFSHSPDPAYDPPTAVLKVLDLRGFRTVLFCAYRSSPVEEVLVTEPEMSSLLPDKKAAVGSD
ncbi:hypothetical protein DNTS_025185 [Danionella cerebrum]|uniref:SLC26A/SulP transporter domain-containing protein n=1 Tax=Danionella cerebrum TaxID=2873325 RepID=A0A553QY06_9TELE|nr:hypothetical protein DNTS_025185 [Danionella translucida]